MPNKQSCDGGAKVRTVVVPELDDVLVSLERRLDDAALNPLAAAVDEPDFPQARLGGGLYVVGDDGRDVARGESVEIELGLDGNAYGRVRHRQRGNAKCRMRNVTTAYA